jgi:putative endonuclease
MGYTRKSVEERLKEYSYNHKGFKSKVKDWNVILKKEIASKSDAIFLENKIKKRDTERYLNAITLR